MENHSQRRTPDASPTHMVDKAMRQSSEEYFRELFGIDDLQLKDTFTADRVSTVENRTASINYRTLYNEMSVKAKELICENEFLRNKLRANERKLVQIMHDRTFLLDRLVAYEIPTNLSLTTGSSSSETEDEACVLSTKSKLWTKTHFSGSKNGCKISTSSKIKRQQ